MALVREPALVGSPGVDDTLRNEYGGAALIIGDAFDLIPGVAAGRDTIEGDYSFPLRIYGESLTMRDSVGLADRIDLGSETITTVHGDTGDMRGASVGGADTIGSIFATETTIYGDAFEMRDTGSGGDDRISTWTDVLRVYGDADKMFGRTVGGDDIIQADFSESAVVFGDARLMSGYSIGGDDGINVSTARVGTTVYGDALRMSDHARGGDDHIGTFNARTSQIFGDARSLSGRAVGGDDLIGAGTGTGSGAHPKIYGDAYSMAGHSRGGNDRLDSGFGDDQMWGDAREMSRGAVGGADIFAFSADLGHDTIYDFEVGKDRIEFTNLVATDGFADLLITECRGDSIVELPNDGLDARITLIDTSGLGADDFLFLHA